MLSIIYWFDLFGVAIFAITGALVAEQEQVNILGVFLAAVMTAVGGGTLRDFLLGQTPVFWIQDSTYLLVIAIAVIGIHVVPTHNQAKSKIFLGG